MHAFIPRNLAGLISETLVVYREGFRVLLGIALLAQLPTLIAALVFSEALVASLTVVELLTGLLASAGVTYAVSQRYLGRTPTIGSSYREALNSGISLLIAFLVFVLLMLGAALLSFILIGIPLLIYLAVVFFFYVQVIMIEGARPIHALGRSRDLVRGSWWRVFGIGIVFILPLVPISLAAEGSRNLLLIAGTSLIIPFVYIGATLLYFDLRIRKEGYNVETLASEIRYREESL